MIADLLPRLDGITRLPGAVDALRSLVLELALDGAFVDRSRDHDTVGRRPLRDVCNIVTGNSINASQKALRYEGLQDGLPYVATKDVDLSTGTIFYENGVKIPLGEPGFKTAPAGAVLICAEGGSAGRKIGLTDRQVCFGNKLFAVVPGPELLPDYLAKALKSKKFMDQFAQNLSGIIGGVSLKRFKEILLPVPTLEEQTATIQALTEVEKRLNDLESAAGSEADARDRLAESAIQELVKAQNIHGLQAAWSIILPNFGRWFADEGACKRLRQAIIDVAVSGVLLPPLEPPQTLTLGELCAFGPKNGFSPKPVAGPTDTKSMSLAAVTRGVFDPSAYKFVLDQPDPSSTLWVRPGDILIQRANTIEYVGVSAVYTGGEREFIYPDLIMRVTPRDDVDSRYLHLALSSSASRHFMRVRASGTSGTMPKINQATVRAIPVRLPALERQKEIVAMVGSILGSIQLMEEAITDHAESGRALLLGFLDGQGGPGPESNGATAFGAHEGSSGPSSPDAQKSPSTAIRAMDLNLRHDDDRAYEALLVSAVVEAFFNRSAEPLGNFRLQKAVYFARRRLRDSRVDVDYLRKAAGPYNPKLRYSGGIAVAKSQGWIREARGRFGFGHIRGANADFAQVSPKLRVVATWVRDTFALRKNEDWERLATVDYAARALQKGGGPVAAHDILHYIGELDEWQHKVAKLGLTEFSVQSALLELQSLFPDHSGALLRADL